MDEKIRESEYGGSPQNLHISRHGEELHVEMTYPNLGEGRCTHVVINQESVRASDGIRVHYDYQRDGFVIEQPKSHMEDRGTYDEEVIEWVETGFFGSWALEEPRPPT